jgi:hypothetical protein
MSVNPIQHKATTNKQRDDSVPTNHRRNPFTPRQTAVLLAGVAALTLALTIVVIDDHDASHAALQTAPSITTPSRAAMYDGTADAAEHRLRITTPSRAAMYDGTADAAEHRLRITTPQRAAMYDGTADAAERRLEHDSTTPG